MVNDSLFLLSYFRTFRSRGVVQIQSSLIFEPEKVNIFNKDCQRGGKEVTCMSVTICLSLHSRTRTKAKPKVEVGEFSSKPVRSKPTCQAQLYLPSSQLLSIQPFITSDLLNIWTELNTDETSDYGRPISVVLETGLQNPDEGPVLDPDQSSILKAELPFWNGCEQEDTCVPDLVLHSHTDLVDVGCVIASPPQTLTVVTSLLRHVLAHRKFCSSRTIWSLCSHQGESEVSARVIETGRRKVVVFAQLENQGENAYGTTVHISTSSNLLFSSLTVKDQSDIPMECSSENSPANELICNISAPFMKTSSQVSFRLEFELSRVELLDHMQVTMTTSSEGEDKNLDDNNNIIFLPLRYQLDLLFTRDPNTPRFQIQAAGSTAFFFSRDEPDSLSHDFNLTYHIQNLGTFPVRGIVFRAEIWAVTRGGNHLMKMMDFRVEQQVSGSHCQLPQHTAANRISAEDLSHLSQLNSSNSASVAAECRLELLTSKELKVTLTGRLQLPALLAVSFRSLEILTTASIWMEPFSPMFLQEDVPVREIILEIRKEEDYINPVWIILGSILGGLLLLALLVLALWKLGFFSRRRKDKEEPVADGKAAEEL
ncbi:hypothetical protein fugu_011917 [Takifugu bimaculatus]|uniref:Integrin alpha-2 domain-containing protein n=1 Tax=Takifugu bimaculatus TaxID=433685 RepID=A0A4Z2C960_9TELE|nr:hypothetical protein fugu_011917 [Takifugu bimaculatus]